MKALKGNQIYYNKCSRSIYILGNKAEKEGQGKKARARAKGRKGKARQGNVLIIFTKF